MGLRDRRDHKVRRGKMEVVVRSTVLFIAGQVHRRECRLALLAASIYRLMQQALLIRGGERELAQATLAGVVGEG